MVKNEIRFKLNNNTGNDQYDMRIFESHPDFIRRNFTGHHHAEFEISYIKSGEGLYIVNDKFYDIKANDIFLFSTNEPHCITEVYGTEPMVLLNFQFEPRLIWSPEGNVFDEKYLRVFLDRNENFENRLSRENPATKQIASLIEEIRTEGILRHESCELMIKVHLLHILVLLIRNYNYVKNVQTVSMRSLNLSNIEKAITFINNNLECELTLEVLAAKANMSRTYFSTAFKRLNGIPPWDYITLKRVGLAKELLSDHSRTIMDIATSCGFNNISHFNRIFKRYTGRTPSEYRKY